MPGHDVDVMAWDMMQYHSCMRSSSYPESSEQNVARGDFSWELQSSTYPYGLILPALALPRDIQTLLVVIKDPETELHQPHGISKRHRHHTSKSTR